MLVRCVRGDGKILIEGETYFVTGVTRRGNFLLDEVECPKGYNCFDATRFEFVNDPVDQWTEEMEKEYWSEQPLSYTGA